MQKIFIIGQSALNFTFPNAAALPCNPVATPAGPLLNAAALLASKGLNVSFVSEAARDFLGSLILNFLKNKNVDTSCIDLFADGGATAMNFRLESSDEAMVTIRNYPENQPFNTTWPRIDNGDIVVFGGFFALNSRSRQQVIEIVNYARERGALIIYLPGFNTQTEPRITRIMPSLLDNLELSDIILASSQALKHLFNIDDPAECFNRNIKFYCNTLIATDSDSIVALHGADSASANFSPQSSPSQIPALAVVLSSLVDYLAKNSFNADSLKSLSHQQLLLLAQESAKPRLL